MRQWLDRIRKSSAILGGFAVIATGLVAMTFHGTEERIADNQRQTLRHSLEALLPSEAYDNDLPTDAIEVTDPLLGTTKPVPVYRARKAGQPAAAVFAAVAPDGYSGEIRLLIAIDADGRVAGVRVLSHRETPGLGDPIDEHKSDWIFGFNGLSLDHPGEAAWKVRRDGGAFDQFTGATITPRAVVKAVRNTLIFFRQNRQPLFSTTAQTNVDAPDEAE